MARALLSQDLSGVDRTKPLSLEELQKNVEDHEGRLDVGDALLAATPGTVSASLALIADADKRISGLLLASTARTATVAGATTGTIAAGAGQIQVIVVTATDANHIIILPAPIPGLIIVLIEASTVGYELRTSDPATIGINGGVAAAGESAIPASSTVIMICETATNWKGLQLSSTAGTLAKVEVAA